MEKNNANRRRIFSRLGLFLVLIIVIIQLFPESRKFKYQYEIGKPWTYELITATFNFPIYKTDDEVKEDENELLKNFTPYFLKDENTANTQLNKWQTTWRTTYGKEPPYAAYINQKLTDIYKKGIISPQTLDMLHNAGSGEIEIIQSNRETKSLQIDELYTPKTAYEEIMRQKPAGFTDIEFRQYNMNLYLVENLRYDSVTSNAVKKDMLKGLSLTSGMVQAGERIIDKGEIITPGTYAILNSLKKELERRNTVFQNSFIVHIGEAIVVIGLLVLLILYLSLFRPLIFGRMKNLLFIAILMLLIIFTTSMVMRFSNASVYIVPFTLLPIIIRVFYDSRTALFVHVITVLIISFMVDNPFLFIILQIAAGMAAVSGLKDLAQRSQLTQTVFYIFITYSVMYLATEFITEGDLTRIHLNSIIYFAISSLLLLFAYVLIYIFEKIFGLISAITLVELTNINSDLMLRFAEQAPGTFQHSLQVSNLATEASKKIGANSLLVRTGALYHDIGKMQNPQYFIENQTGGDNPLLKMSYTDAAQAIIQHISDGIALAKKNRLPDQIIAFISTHHGRSKVKYFYNLHANENPDAKIDEEKFTYPGPLPFSKETAILMMADAVEARSRTLEIYTEKSIAEMVDKMIDVQIAEGQFKNAPISFQDVEIVKKVLIEKLMNVYHSRIIYPELNKGESNKQ